MERVGDSLARAGRRALFQTALVAMAALTLAAAPPPAMEARLLELRKEIDGATERGALPEAVSACLRAQEFYLQAKDQEGQGRVLSQLATLYRSMGWVKEALASESQAITLAEALGDLALQATFRLELANIHRSMDDLEREGLELDKARQLAVQAGDPEVERQVTLALADSYLRRKDFKAALTWAEAALPMFREAQDTALTTQCQVKRGLALSRLGKAKEGLEALSEALVYYKSIHSKENVLLVTGMLAEEQAFAGAFTDAYKTHVAFKELSDEAQKEGAGKRIAEAKAALDAERGRLQAASRARALRTRLLWAAVGVLTLGLLLAGRKLLRTRKALAAARRSLAEERVVDPLTGLHNRRFLELALPAELHQSQRALRELLYAGQDPLDHKEDILLFLLDLDDFKSVYGTFGQAAGDAVLRQASERLKGITRASDFLVRWDDEQFLLVLKRVRRSSAPTVAANLLEVIRAQPFALPGGKELSRTCSIGSAAYPLQPEQPEAGTWDLALEVAQQCLFLAKNSGRDRWVGGPGAAGPARTEDVNV